MTQNMLPILDNDFLDTLAVDIGMDGAAEAAQIFVEDAAARVTRLHQADRGGNAVVRREAHALAGSARAVGLARLGHTAAALQRALEVGPADPAALPELEALLWQSVAALEAWKAMQPALT